MEFSTRKFGVEIEFLPTVEIAAVLQEIRSTGIK